MGGRIGRRRKIFEILCTPIPMVPRLYQSNGYMQGKIRVSRVQKCITLVSAENIPVRGRKIPRYMGSGIGPRMQICETLCTLIPMVPRLQ